MGIYKENFIWIALGKGMYQHITIMLYGGIR